MSKIEKTRTKRTRRDTTSPRLVTRRSFVSSAGAAALSFTIVKPDSISGTPANSRIEAGCIGLGNRGKMIAGMLEKHGGYQITAVADYFAHVDEAAGEG